MPTSKEIRKTLLDIFAEHSHEFVSSNALVPHNDRQRRHSPVQERLHWHQAPYRGATTSRKLPRIDVIEQLGSELLADVLVGGSSLIVSRIDPEREIAPGEPVSLVLHPSRLHFFDRDTEAAIQ